MSLMSCVTAFDVWGGKFFFQNLKIYFAAYTFKCEGMEGLQWKLDWAATSRRAQTEV